jgi:quercetin dioxygenase-like cupin family protein
MRHAIGATIAAALAVLAPAATPAPAAAQARPDYPGVEARDRFAGSLRLSARDGSARALQVEVHHWSIRGGQRATPAASPGFRVMQLLAGAVTTVIDGQRVARREGEFWTVPAGAALGLETGDDTAVLQVTTVR